MEQEIDSFLIQLKANERKTLFAFSLKENESPLELKT